MRKEKEKDFKKRGKKKKKERKKERRKKERKKEKEIKVLNRSDTLTLFEDIFNQRNTSSKRIVRYSVFLCLFSLLLFLIKRKREKREKP